jgi:hypothetical protein
VNKSLGKDVKSVPNLTIE